MTASTGKQTSPLPGIGEPPPGIGEGVPAWVREVDFSLALQPHVLMTGNIRDQYPIPVTGPDGKVKVDYIGMNGVLWRVCRARGFAALAELDPVTARLTIQADGEIPSVLAPFDGKAFTVTDPAGSPRLDIVRLGELLRTLAQYPGPAVGLVIPYAARMFPAVGMPDPGMLELLGRIEALGHTAIPTRPPPQTDQNPGQHHPESIITPFNTVFWQCDRQEDLHAAFPLSSRSLRLIRVPNLTFEARSRAAQYIMGDLDRPDSGPKQKASPEARALAEVTHGMTVRELFACARVAASRQLPPDRFAEAARLMRVGVTDDPWSAEALREKLESAEAYLNERVLGQERAVRKTLDVLFRSAVGLNGAHVSSSPNRPRGVLFLSGPTGVGKTELAKGIASLVLGGDAEPLRFDMSEFRADEAHQRLIGAPPGYVGFDAGGELTNAVRSNPVCVLLFDEIEKAHARIFDLFLQILEDGRLTDSRGATVHFTESFLIFTSNLGVASQQKAADRGGGGDAKDLTMRDLVHSGMDAGRVEMLLRQAYDQFFNEDIGRPELRNRVGDNYVALAYITDETVVKIVDRGLGNVASRVHSTTKAHLVVHEDVREELIDAAQAKKEDGGRGVNNVMESALVNPLSRELFERPPGPGETVELTGLKYDDDQGWVLEVRPREQ